MDSLTVSVLVARPREEVFAYLADMANHAEFCDHFMVDWHLTREDSFGVGAGARFKIKAPKVNRFPWGDATFTEVEAPRRIVERGRVGKFNRILTRGVYELEPAAGGSTRVSFTFETKPKTPSDKLLDIGARRWTKRRLAKALRRLRDILEEDRGRGERASIAGGPRKPASQYRYDPSLAATPD